MHAPLQRALGGLVLAWALASMAATWWATSGDGPDGVTVLEAEFRTLARMVPSSLTVGYLEPQEHADSPENILEYYVAQYAFAPRLVVRRTDEEFLLVPSSALRPDDGEPLADFEPLARSASGHRLYRRRGW
jgi:hypothetical protein